MRRSALIVALVVLAMDCGFFVSRTEAAPIVVFSNGNTLFSYELTETAGQPKVAASLIMSDGAATKVRTWYTLGETETSGTYHLSFEGVKGQLTGTAEDRGMTLGGNGWYYQTIFIKIKGTPGAYRSESFASIEGMFAITGTIVPYYSETLTTFVGGLSFPVEWWPVVYPPPETFDLPWMDRSVTLTNVPITPNVPEPTSFAIAVLGGFALLRRRH